MLFLGSSTPFFAGYTAAVDIQRQFILTTGHLYSGQLGHLVTPAENNFGWFSQGGAPTSLLVDVLYAMLTQVVGVSFSNSFGLALLPLGIPIVFPILFLGIYKTVSKQSFSRMYGVIVFSFSTFLSFFFESQVPISMFGLPFLFYLLVPMTLIFGWLPRNRATLILYFMSVITVSISYHTLAEYETILIAALLLYQFLSSALKSGDTLSVDRRLLLAGLVIGIALEAFVLVQPVLDVSSLLSGRIFSSFTEVLQLPNVNTSLTNSGISFLDILSSAIVAAICIAGFIIGSRSVWGFRRNRVESELGFLTFGLLVIVIGLVIAVGPFRAIERSIQAVIVFTPFILIVLVQTSGKRFGRIMMILALVSAALVASGTVLAPSLAFGSSSFLVTSGTIPEMGYVANHSASTSSVFTNFLLSQTLIYFGHPDSFGLSQYKLSGVSFDKMSNTFYVNGSVASITSTIRELTGDSHTIFLFQVLQLGSIPLESTTFSPPSTSYIKTYQDSFNLVYSSSTCDAFYV
jgi:hypothetical protein